MLNNNRIEEAVLALKKGGLVAFPTETVYGLGADATNPSALKKIFHVKQRPTNHPLIVHLGNVSDIEQWTNTVSKAAWLLADAFWPGPLTLILPAASHVSPLVTGGQTMIGLRVPEHPLAQALLNAFDGGLAAPSANRFGRISPTTAEAVRDELGDAVDVILDGGQCRVGLESTIVALNHDQPRILRPGMITAEQIESVLKMQVGSGEKSALRVSGSLVSHYAPTTPTYLMSRNELVAHLAKMVLTDFPAVVLAQNAFPVRDPIECVMMPESASDYAHRLYDVLRACDKKGYKRIIVESVPDGSKWDAIRDRLNRACIKA